MSSVVVRLSPVIAGLLDAPIQTLTVPVRGAAQRSVASVLRHLERHAPGVLFDPRRGEIRRHIQVYVNRRPVAELSHPIRGGDVVEVDLRMLEGG